MKTKRICVSDHTVDSLAQMPLYLKDPGTPVPAEHIEPTHLHIFSNGNLLVCLEETNQNSLVFDERGASLYSGLELHQEVIDGWVVIGTTIDDPQNLAPGQRLRAPILSGLDYGSWDVLTEEEARRRHQENPGSLLINLSAAHGGEK